MVNGLVQAASGILRRKMRPERIRYVAADALGAMQAGWRDGSGVQVRQDRTSSRAVPLTQGPYSCAARIEATE